MGGRQDHKEESGGPNAAHEEEKSIGPLSRAEVEYKCPPGADWCLVDNVSRRLDSAAKIHSAALSFDI